MKLTLNKQTKQIEAIVIGGDAFALCEEEKELTPAEITKMNQQLTKLAKYEEKVKAAKAELGKATPAPKKKPVAKKPNHEAAPAPVAEESVKVEAPVFHNESFSHVRTSPACGDVTTY